MQGNRRIANMESSVLSNSVATNQKPEAKKLFNVPIPAMDTPTTANDLSAAVDCLDGASLADFRTHWGGQPDVPITLVRYAARIGCNPDDVALSKALSDLNAITSEQWNNRASRLLQITGEPVNVALMIQAANLIQAFIATVTFAQRFVADGKQLTDVGAKRLQSAAQLWHQSWPLSSTPIPSVNLFAVTPQAGSATALLYQIIQPRNGNTESSLDVCTFLILQRLLGVLLSQPVALISFRNDLRMLLVGKKAGLDAGEVRSVSFLRVNEAGIGFYPDPVAFGVTPLDEDMLTSLQIAWAATENSISHTTDSSTHRSNSGPVVRIQPKFGPLDILLTGDSAGALCACGLYATAIGQPLDAAVSASCRLNAHPDEVKDLASIPLGKVGGLVAKVQEAAEAKHGLRRVVVWEEQFDDELANLRFNVSLGKAKTLADVYRQMMGDTAKSEILRRWCVQQVEKWEAALKDPNDIDQVVRLLLPSFSILKEDQAPADVRGRLGHFAKNEPQDAGKADPYVPVPGDGPQHFARLLSLSAHLCITEDAGAGKSVASRLLTAFVSSPLGYEQIFDGQPCLAVRYEESEDIWPKDIAYDLAALIRPFVNTWNERTSGDPQTPEGVVSWALQKGRVFLALDGLDQVADKERLGVIRNFLRREGQHARVLLTGRPHTISGDGDVQQQNLLTGISWRFGRINPFSLKNQYRYLEDLLPTEHRGLLDDDDELDERLKTAISTRLPDYDLISELLSTPIILRIVRDVLQENSDARFISRGDLYAQASRMTILRAGRKLAEQFDWRQDEDVDLLEQIQAAVAFQMAVEDEWGYSVQGADAVRKLRLAAARRCGVPPLKPGGPPNFTDRDWKLFLAATNCTNRSIFEATKDDLICFRHRGFMEFYAALHLVKNQQPGWRQTEGSETAPTRISCGDPDLKKHTNDPNWYWVWRFATEIPPEVCDPAIQLASLSELFRQPQTEIRPTELIFRAWHLFELDDRLLKQRQFRLPDGRIVFGQDLSVTNSSGIVAEEQRRRWRQELGTSLILPGADVVLKEFRHSSQTLVKEIQRQTQEWNKVPATGARDHARFLKKWEQQSSAVKSHTFLQCPPQSWVGPDGNSEACVNVMGDDGHYVSEKPQHRIRVEPYLLQATPVTRGQYAQFDPAFAASTVKASWGGVIKEKIEQYAHPKPTYAASEQDATLYPIIMTSWYDAWAYCKWLGPEYALPSECRHEFGIRGGSTGDYCFGDDTHGSKLKEYAWFDENSDNHAHVVGLKRANAYGLYDVHGQVWEWSWDWKEDAWYGERVAGKSRGEIVSEDTGPASGSVRSLRGSSVGDVHDRVLARSSYRAGSTPAVGNTGIGFRCSRAVYSPQSSSSPSDALSSDL